MIAAAGVTGAEPLHCGQFSGGSQTYEGERDIDLYYRHITGAGVGTVQRYPACTAYSERIVCRMFIDLVDST